MLNFKALCILGVVLAAGPALAADDEWIRQSNGYSQLLLDVQAKYSPESATAVGVAGLEGEVMDLKPLDSERQEADLLKAAEQLQALRSRATDSRIKQDLDILLTSAQDQRRTLELNRQLMVPYFDLPQALFGGFRKLIHEGVAPERQAKALLRLRRYAGREKGYDPIASLARARIAAGLQKPALVAPWNVEVQQSLDNQQRYLDGVRDLFKQSKLKGWQGDFAALSKQVLGYGDWLKSDLMPRARKSNRLPEAIYADNLKSFGVDADPRQIMQQALTAYAQIREEMAALAAVVAAQRGLKETAYPDVLRELKKQSIPKDQLLQTYRARLAAVEDIVRKQRLATLPVRAAVIRLASEAESAATPAPHIDVPPLIGNTGQPAAFVIPVSNPNAMSGEDFNDFSFDAVAWTLTTHEARPGHELQISRMLEQGVSTARALFAFNSANVEGWALYAEAFMKPYLPLDGQLAVLQLRLMRSARAFLDPMLNLGLIEPDAAKHVLMREVCLSEPMAKQEVDRYTFNAPGQATSYFFGYQQLEATRARAEIALGTRFDVQSYHDFILNQGLLPLRLLDTAVMEEYVPSRRQ